MCLLSEVTKIVSPETQAIPNLMLEEKGEYTTFHFWVNYLFNCDFDFLSPESDNNTPPTEK